jgi:hypothetical protein
MVKTENYQSSTWKPYSRECKEEGVVRGYVSTGRTFTTVTLQHAARDGNEARVTVAAHESNSKMAHIFRRLNLIWCVGL